jgi:hypothetical protein
MPATALSDLLARQAITDVIHRYCRALDRMDRDLLLSCWHEGGTDDHSPQYAGSAEGFADWIWPLHAALLFTRHRCGAIAIELDGDRAAAESACDILLRVRRGEEIYDLAMAGRYLDRFERIDGIWAIRHRLSLSEWHRVGKVDLRLRDFDPPLLPPAGADPGRPGAGARMTRNDRDPSYEFLVRRPIRGI